MFSYLNIIHTKYNFSARRVRKSEHLISDRQPVLDASSRGQQTAGRVSDQKRNGEPCQIKADQPIQSSAPN